MPIISFSPYWFLLFGVGIASGFLNVMAGGGSTLTLPVLIFMGLDGALANGTNRVAILIQNISSVSAFQRSEPYPLRTVLAYAAWTLPGAVAGAYYATKISDEFFQTILGLIILGVLSMVVGVFLAVGQWDLKRLLAYHSISQMGYVILGIGIKKITINYTREKKEKMF